MATTPRFEEEEFLPDRNYPFGVTNQSGSVVVRRHIRDCPLNRALYDYHDRRQELFTFCA